MAMKGALQAHLGQVARILRRAATTSTLCPGGTHGDTVGGSGDGVAGRDRPGGDEDCGAAGSAYAGNGTIVASVSVDG